MLPFLILVCLFVVGCGILQNQDAVCDDARLAANLPALWQTDVESTLKIVDGMADDVSLWYQLVNRKPGDRRPLIASPHPCVGPFDFHLQMLCEGRFARRFIGEISRIYDVKNMSVEAKLSHFADRQWQGRFNGYPMADSMVSGLVIIFATEEQQ